MNRNKYTFNKYAHAVKVAEIKNMIKKFAYDYNYDATYSIGDPFYWTPNMAMGKTLPPSPYVTPDFEFKRQRALDHIIANRKESLQRELNKIKAPMKTSPIVEYEKNFIKNLEDSRNILNNDKYLNIIQRSSHKPSITDRIKNFFTKNNYKNTYIGLGGLAGTAGIAYILHKYLNRNKDKKDNQKEDK